MRLTAAIALLAVGQTAARAGAGPVGQAGLVGRLIALAVADALAGDYDPALVPTSPTGVSAWRPNPHGTLERRYYVYKRDGMPCRQCGSRVRTAVVAGRNLFWCGRCQRRR